MMGTAEAIAITITSTANISPPMFPRIRPGSSGPMKSIGAGAKGAGTNEKQFLVGFGLETEVDGLRLVARDGHVLGLGSVVFMPGGDGVLSRGQVGRESPHCLR